MDYGLGGYGLWMGWLWTMGWVVVDYGWVGYGLW